MGNRTTIYRLIGIRAVESITLKNISTLLGENNTQYGKITKKIKVG